MKVFIVDDEFLQRQLVKKTVNWEKLGLEIAGEAEDGEEALDKILEEKPDILIMDINIPLHQRNSGFGKSKTGVAGYSGDYSYCLWGI